MTYYGRWTYKYEIAAGEGRGRRVIIHETEPAAYPYSVIFRAGRENFEVDAANKKHGQVQIRFLDRARVSRRKLMAESGQDFDALKKAAITKDFPVSLGAKATSR